MTASVCKEQDQLTVDVGERFLCVKTLCAKTPLCKDVSVQTRLCVKAPLCKTSRCKKLLCVKVSVCKSFPV